MSNGNLHVSDEEPGKAELKALHKIIKKVQDDIERFSFNTSVSSFMIAVNELTDLKCNKRSILSELTIVLSPYAPHICEELWTLLGHAARYVYLMLPIQNLTLTTCWKMNSVIRFPSTVKPGLT